MASVDENGHTSGDCDIASNNHAVGKRTVGVKVNVGNIRIL